MIVLKKDIDMLRGASGETALRVDFGQREAKCHVQGSKLAVGKYTIDLTKKLKDSFCYLLNSEGLNPIAFFSQKTGRFYKLLATKDWPTIVIGSVPMHRVRDVSPKEDTLAKIKALKPKGNVLDTCTGLGYTAIAAAERSDRVLTCENDPEVRFMAKLNPFSKELFNNAKIEMKLQDVSCYVKNARDGAFDTVIHDPPTFTMAPALYSVDFYKELLRIMKPKGRLYHYAPYYGIRRGIDFPARIEKKLKQAGFIGIDFSRIVCGFLCKKPVH